MVIGVIWKLCTLFWNFKNRYTPPLMDIINSLLKTGNKTANINVKNCSLYTLLTPTDLKPQKS